MKGGVGGSGADGTDVVVIIGAGAGGVAGATGAGAEAGGGKGDVALIDTGLWTGTFISPGGSVRVIRIGVTNGTSGRCQVTSREYSTFLVQ